MVAAAVGVGIGVGIGVAMGDGVGRGLGLGLSGDVVEAIAGVALASTGGAVSLDPRSAVDPMVEHPLSTMPAASDTIRILMAASCALGARELTVVPAPELPDDGGGQQAALRGQHKHVVQEVG